MFDNPEDFAQGTEAQRDALESARLELEEAERRPKGGTQLRHLGRAEVYLQEADMGFRLEGIDELEERADRIRSNYALSRPEGPTVWASPKPTPHCPGRGGV